jgi:hypothetical protein
MPLTTLFKSKWPNTWQMSVDNINSKHLFLMRSIILIAHLSFQWNQQTTTCTKSTQKEISKGVLHSHLLLKHKSNKTRTSGQNLYFPTKLPKWLTHVMCDAKLNILQHEEIRTQRMLHPDGFLQMPQCSATAVCICCWPTDHKFKYNVQHLPEDHQQHSQHTARNLDNCKLCLKEAPLSITKKAENSKHFWHND